MRLPAVLESTLETQYGTFESFTSASGGCINNGGVARFRKTEFFIKWNSAVKYPDMFEVEAKGLNYLRQGSLKIPEVLQTGSIDQYSYLLLEPILERPYASNYWQELGQGLASQHRITADHFGLNHDNYMGSLKQSNKIHTDWISFYIEERISPQIKMAVDKGYFSGQTLRGVGSFYKNLETILIQEPPSLVHGDLWSGNIMRSNEGRPVLIDPAISFSHREVDIAMTKLFGGFEQVFYDAYIESFPLENEWQKRLDIYQLYPLLIHLNLFGSGYYSQCLSIIYKYA